MPTALGIDVGVRKGLDAVALDENRRVVARRRRLRPPEVVRLIEETNPDVITVDSPPAWALEGGSRLAERELLRAGIHAFATPSETRGAGRRFYEWMQVGFEVFRVASALGYPRYVEGPVAGTAAEVFPHASAVALAGRRPPLGMGKAPWRRGVLEAERVQTDDLRPLDQLDAALAALTGLYALEGCFCLVGDPPEGSVLLPVTSLPGRYLRTSTT